MAKHCSKSKRHVLREQGVLNPRPQKVIDPLFSKSEFFDPEDMVQVKYEMVRKHLKEGETITKVSESFGLSRPAFYKAQTALEEEGVAGLVPKKRGPQGPHKLTAEVMDAVEEWLLKDPSLKKEDLAGLIMEEFGVNVHPVSLSRVLAARKKKRKQA